MSRRRRRHGGNFGGGNPASGGGGTDTAQTADTQEDAADTHGGDD